MTSKGIWRDIFTEVIEVIEHHMPISHSPCRRRSIGPLPSCFFTRGHSRNGAKVKVVTDLTAAAVVRAQVRFEIGAGRGARAAPYNAPLTNYQPKKHALPTRGWISQWRKSAKRSCQLSSGHGWTAGRARAGAAERREHAQKGGMRRFGNP